jgi:outer membrane protein TolC
MCKERRVHASGTSSVGTLRRSVWMWTALIALGALGAGAGRARAQSMPVSQAAAPMTRVEFDEAVARALAKNPTVASAATNISRAEALLQQARAATMPGVTATFTNLTLDHAVKFGGGTTQPQNQSTFALQASIPVLAASRWASVAQARDQIDVATLSVAEVRQQIAVSAAQTYLAVIANRRQVDVDTRARSAARAHLDYAQRRLDAGAGSRLDQLRAAQSVSSDESRLENSRLGLRRAQEALGVLLAENGPVDAGAEPTFDVPATIDDNEWMAARPDVRFQSAVIKAGERVVADGWKDWLPTGTAAFAPQYVTPKGLFQPSKSWRLTVSVAQPIFEGGQHKATMALRNVTLDQSKIQLTSIELAARAEIRIAQASLDSNQRALANARLAADQANEVLQITMTAFEVGATTNIEVIDAQRTARDAETTAALAEDAVRRARLDLLVAIGRFPK